MTFKAIHEILVEGIEGNVAIRGWVHNKRSSGGIQFLMIRDGTGLVQCTVKKDAVGDELFEDVDKLPLESVIEVSGTSRKDARSPYGFELSAEKINILSKADEDFPIAKKYHGPDFLLDNRHLFLRTRKMQIVMTVRSRVIQLIREWFTFRGYKEFQSPILTKAACEGGATLFPVKYFDDEAYLTQSWQLYAEAAIASLGKIFTIAPSFRAEKSRTRRHLTEYWHVEMEEPWIDLEGLMRLEEELVSFICQKVAEDFPGELEELGRNPEELKAVRPPFKRMTYKEAVEALQKKGMGMKYGDDLGADEEKELTKDLKLPVFIHHYPIEAKAFYVKEDKENPGTGLAVDMLAPEGIGEITGGTVRETEIEKMKARIGKDKLDSKDFEWYFDLRRWGSVEHGGFGLGLERLLMWICKLEHVRDAIAFPRVMNRIYP